jgi:hypothetical protein
VRPRTAVGIAVGFVVLKALLTYIAFRTMSVPHRRWIAPANWHVELGALGTWVGATATFIAAAVALLNAGNAARARRRELRAAEYAQARLVTVEIRRSAFGPDFVVTIRNYGDRPIIGANVVDAHWITRPDVTWRKHPDYTDNDAIPILQPEIYRDPTRPATLHIQFLDGNGNVVPHVLRQDSAYREDIEYEPISGEPEVEIGFEDANGNGWRTGSPAGAAVRRV